MTVGQAARRMVEIFDKYEFQEAERNAAIAEACSELTGAEVQTQYWQD